MLKDTDKPFAKVFPSVRIYVSGDVQLQDEHEQLQHSIA